MTRDNIGADSGSGYGRPPASTRFRKGQSGNPSGRPQGRHKEAPYEAVLGQLVKIREGGIERQATASEPFLLQLAKRGLEWDTNAARATMTAISEVKILQTGGTWTPIDLVVRYVAPGSVNTALEPLRMAKKLDPYRETVRMTLQPWLVEAALASLGDVV